MLLLKSGAQALERDALYSAEHVVVLSVQRMAPIDSSVPSRAIIRKGLVAQGTPESVVGALFKRYTPKVHDDNAGGGVAKCYRMLCVAAESHAQRVAADRFYQMAQVVERRDPAFYSLLPFYEPSSMGIRTLRTLTPAEAEWLASLIERHPLFMCVLDGVAHHSRVASNLSLTQLRALAWDWRTYNSTRARLAWHAMAHARGSGVARSPSAALVRRMAAAEHVLSAPKGTPKLAASVAALNYGATRTGAAAPTTDDDSTEEDTSDEEDATGGDIPPQYGSEWVALLDEACGGYGRFFAPYVLSTAWHVCRRLWTKSRGATLLTKRELMGAVRECIEAEYPKRRLALEWEHLEQMLLGGSRAPLLAEAHMATAHWRQMHIGDECCYVSSRSDASDTLVVRELTALRARGVEVHVAHAAGGAYGVALLVAPWFSPHSCVVVCENEQARARLEASCDGVIHVYATCQEALTQAGAETVVVCSAHDYTSGAEWPLLASASTRVRRVVYVGDTLHPMADAPLVSLSEAVECYMDPPLEDTRYDDQQPADAIACSAAVLDARAWLFGASHDVASDALEIVYSELVASHAAQWVRNEGALVLTTTRNTRKRVLQGPLGDAVRVGGYIRDANTGEVRVLRWARTRAHGTSRETLDVDRFGECEYALEGVATEDTRHIMCCGSLIPLGGVHAMECGDVLCVADAIRWRARLPEVVYFLADESATTIRDLALGARLATRAFRVVVGSSRTLARIVERGRAPAETELEHRLRALLGGAQTQ